MGFRPRKSLRLLEIFGLSLFVLGRRASALSFFGARPGVARGFFVAKSVLWIKLQKPDDQVPAKHAQTYALERFSFVDAVRKEVA